MAGTALGISEGGTSQKTAPGARIALGLGPDSDVTFNDGHFQGDVIIDGNLTVGGAISVGGDLGAIEALTGTGFAARTAADTWALRTFTGTANEVAITNGAGVAGNPVLSLPNALVFTGKTITGGIYDSAQFNGSIGLTTPSTGAFTTLSASGAFSLTSDDVQVSEGGTGVSTITGLVSGNGTSAFVGRTIVVPTGMSIANGNGATGNPTISLANDLAAIEALNTNAILARTGTDTWAARTITGTADQITVTNGSGVSGNPTLSLPVGTLLAGTWSPTITNVTNVEASATATCHYIQVGSQVFCWGIIAIDVTSAVGTQFGLSLPIASNFASASNCAGSGGHAGTSSGVRITADTTNNRADVLFTAVTTANANMSFNFGYTII